MQPEAGEPSSTSDGVLHEMLTAPPGRASSRPSARKIPLVSEAERAVQALAPTAVGKDGLPIGRAHECGIVRHAKRWPERRRVASEAFNPASERGSTQHRPPVVVVDGRPGARFGAPQ
jgi:hypothetical protein